MVDKLMYIPTYDTQKYNKFLKNLDNKLNEPTNQKSPNLLSQRIRKRFFFKQPNVPSVPDKEYTGKKLSERKDKKTGGDNFNKGVAQSYQG